MTKTYLIRRRKDNRLMSGLFSDISTHKKALKEVKYWETRCPSDEFYIETIEDME